MATQGRFRVLTDENQPPQASSQASFKRAPLSVLSEIPKKSSSNILKPSTTRSFGRVRSNENVLIEKKNTISKDDQENRFETQQQPRKLAPQTIENIENFKVLDAQMISPLPLDSPMVISPAPQDLSKSTETKAKSAIEDLLDDDFFTRQYGDSHYAYMRDMELKFRPRSDYMGRQRDISSEMRSVMVDWLVEVNEEYNLSDETLFLTVSLVDRFLSLMSVVRNKLQLVGTSAMFVASKVEEIYPPQIQEMVYITDDSYSASQIVRMEALLLKNLSFSIGCFHPLTFLRNIAVFGKLSLKVAHMAQYIAELSLLNINSLAFRASEIAAASLVIAMKQINGNTRAWTPKLKEYASIDSDQMKMAIKLLHSILMGANSSSHQAIPGKYSHNKYSSVSLLELKTGEPELDD